MTHIAYMLSVRQERTTNQKGGVDSGIHTFRKSGSGKTSKKENTKEESTPCAGVNSLRLFPFVLRVLEFTRFDFPNGDVCAHTLVCLANLRKYTNNIPLRQNFRKNLWIPLCLITEFKIKVFKAFAFILFNLYNLISFNRTHSRRYWLPFIKDMFFTSKGHL